MKKIFMKKKSKLRDNNTVDEENKENFSNKLNSNASSSTSTNSLIKPLRNLLSFKHKNTKQMNTDKKGNLCDNKNLHSMADKENQENCQMVLMPKPLENVEDTIGETLSTLPINSSTKPFRSLLNFHEKRVMIDKKENSYDNMGLEISEVEGNKKNCKMDLMPKLLDNAESTIDETSLDLLTNSSKKSFRSLLSFRHKNARRGNTDGKGKLSDNIDIGILTGEENKDNYKLNLMSNPLENVKTTLDEASLTSPNLPSTRPLKDLNLPRIFKQKNNVHLEEYSAAKMKKMSKKLKTKNMEVEIDQKVVNGLLDLSNRDLIVAPKFYDISIIEELMIYDNRLENIDEIATLTQMKRCFLQQNKIKTVPISFSQCILLTIVDLRCNELTEFPECLLLLQHLEMLVMSRNKISLIPDHLESLQNLCVFVIDRNRLTRIPKTISKMKKLEIINFSVNKITQVPTELGDCQSLTKIDIMNNNIYNLPETLGNLKNLTRLNACQNQIEYVPQSFAHFEKLEEFYLHNNRLHSLPDQLLHNFHKLDDVNLSRNLLITFPTGGPDQFMCTKFLNLSGNFIRFIPIGIFSLAKELKFVNLSDNCIKTLIPNDVAKWTTITELDLSYNGISRLPAEIGHLTKMKSLKLCSNIVRRLPPEIGDMESLVELNLKDNQIQELPLEIGNLKSLENLDLSCNLLESLPTTIGNMYSLKCLNLEENILKTIPPEIGKLQKLKELLLKKNPDLNSLPEELCLCTSLERVSTRYCGMKNFPPDIINCGTKVLMHFLVRKYYDR